MLPMTTRMWSSQDHNTQMRSLSGRWMRELYHVEQQMEGVSEESPQLHSYSIPASLLSPFSGAVSSYILQALTAKSQTLLHILYLHISVVTPHLYMYTYMPHPYSHFKCNLLYSIGVLCPVPIPPFDGEVSWINNEVGAALHYYCREGFDLVGTASQECLPIGEWSSYTPLCMKGESVGGDACM